MVLEPLSNDGVGMSWNEYSWWVVVVVVVAPFWLLLLLLLSRLGSTTTTPSPLDSCSVVYCVCFVVVDFVVVWMMMRKFPVLHHCYSSLCFVVSVSYPDDGDHCFLDWFVVVVVVVVVVETTPVVVPPPPSPPRQEKYWSLWFPERLAMVPPELVRPVSNCVVVRHEHLQSHRVHHHSNADRVWQREHHN